MEYIFNKHGVCENPTIIFTTSEEGKHYGGFSIEVAELNGYWDYGYSFPNGCGPCSPKWKKFKSKEEAIEDSVEFLKKQAERYLNGETGLMPNGDKYARKFLDWCDSRNQLSLF